MSLEILQLACSSSYASRSPVSWLTSGMASPPIPSAEKIRRNASSPCPILLRRVCPLFPLFQHFPHLVSNFPPSWAMVQPVFFLVPCVFRITCTFCSPTNQCRTFFSAPILLPRPTSTSHCGAHLSMTRGSSLKHRLEWLQLDSLPSTLRTRVLAAISSNRPCWLVKNIFFPHCGHTTLMSASTCTLTQQGVQLWPLTRPSRKFRT